MPAPHPIALPNDATRSLLTASEAAEMLRVSKSTITQLVAGRITNQPPLPCIRMGRRILIRKDTLDRFMKNAEGVDSAA